MAANNEWHRVRANRSANRANGLRAADSQCDFSIGFGLAKTNFADLCPYRSLKLGALELNVKVQNATLASEEVFELSFGSIEHLGVAKVGNRWPTHRQVNDLIVAGLENDVADR